MPQLSTWFARVKSHLTEAPDINRTSRRFSDWSAAGRGQLLRERERLAINSLCARHFGFHAAQLSILDEAFALPDLCVPHQFKLHPFSQAAGVNAQADFTQLPLGDEQLDWVLLQHLLEYHQDPHAVMREAARVLRPRGYLVVVLFNPFHISHWGARLSPWLGIETAPPRRFMPAYRVRDWLRLLDLTLVEERAVDFLCTGEQVTLDTQLQCAPPRDASPAWWRDNPVTSVARVIVARKDVAPLIPIKPMWQIVRQAPNWASARQSLWRMPKRRGLFKAPVNLDAPE